MLNHLIKTYVTCICICVGDMGDAMLTFAHVPAAVPHYKVSQSRGSSYQSLQHAVWDFSNHNCESNKLSFLSSLAQVFPCNKDNTLAKKDQNNKVKGNIKFKHFYKVYLL